MSGVEWIGRAVLVLVVAALVAAAALVLSARQQAEYASVTRLLFDDARPELQVLGAGYAGDRTEVDVRMANEAAGLNGFAIAVRTGGVVDDLGRDAEQVADAVEASAVRGAEIVELRATAESPGAAQALAREYRRQYLRGRRAAERRRADAAYEALDARLDDLPLRERAGALGATLRQQLGALQVLRDVGSGVPEVIEPARQPSGAVAPQTGRNVLLGAVLGLALGVGLVALRAELARRRGPSASATRPSIRDSAEADGHDVGPDADGQAGRRVAPVEGSG